jgi:hypothetical protein
MIGLPSSLKSSVERTKYPPPGSPNAVWYVSTPQGDLMWFESWRAAVSDAVEYAREYQLAVLRGE